MCFKAGGWVGSGGDLGWFSCGGGGGGVVGLGAVGVGPYAVWGVVVFQLGGWFT